MGRVAELGSLGDISTSHIIQTPYHILVSLLLDGQPTLIDPATKQVLEQGKGDLAKVLQQNSDLNPERKTIHMEILEPKNDA